MRELGASGQGALRHAVLLGTDDSGAALVSLFTGFGMSDFTSASRYVGADHPMYVTDSVQGPADEARIVGIVGIATSVVSHVTLEVADGRIINLAVQRVAGSPYGGFSYVSRDPSTFPTRVVAHDATGNVLAQHAVDATPLCAADQTGCFGS